MLIIFWNVSLKCISKVPAGIEYIELHQSDWYCKGFIEYTTRNDPVTFIEHIIALFIQIQKKHEATHP